MTCTSAEMTKIPFITILLCVSPSYFSLSPPPLLCIYFFPQRVFFGNPSAVTRAFSISRQLARIFLYSPPFFWDVTTLYFLFHSCTVPICPQTVSYITLEHNSKNKKIKKLLSLNKLFEGMSLLLAVDRGLQFAIYNIYFASLWGNPAGFWTAQGHGESLAGSPCSCSCFV